jgi:hypothetical protein
VCAGARLRGVLDAAALLPPALALHAQAATSITRDSSPIRSNNDQALEADSQRRGPQPHRRIAKDVRDVLNLLQEAINRSLDALNRLQQVTGALSSGL